jgi:ankyrin repeat protein
VVRLLVVERKADIHAKDNDGRTALHRTAENELEVVVRLLLEHKADVYAKDNHGLTALPRSGYKSAWS